MRFARAVAAVTLAAVLVAVTIAPARAFFQVFAAPAARLLPWAAGPLTRGIQWLGGRIAANPQAWRAAESSLYVNTAFLAAMFLAAEDKNPLSDSSARFGAIVELVPETPLQNPDPTKWDDPPSGSVDPTPKPILDASSNYPSTSGTTPSTYAAVNSSMTPGQVKTYTNTNGTPQVYLKLENATPMASQPSFLNGARDPISSGSFQPGFIVWIRAYTANPSAGVYQHIYYLTMATTASATRAITWNDLNGCSAGYTYNSSSGKCDLTDASQVMKPDAPCEVVWTGGQWRKDPKNPRCLGANTAAFTTMGDRVAVNYNDNTSTEVARSTDSSLTITDSDPTQGRTIIRTGPYDSTNQGFRIISVTREAGGTGTPPGSGGGSCGGTSQPACRIDDSGFTGAATSVQTAASGALAQLDARENFLGNLPSSQNAGDHGIQPGSLFSLTGRPQLACQPLSAGFIGGPISIDICPGSPAGTLIDIVRWVVEALLAWTVMTHLWRRFTTSAAPSNS